MTRAQYLLTLATVVLVSLIAFNLHLTTAVQAQQESPVSTASASVQQKLKTLEAEIASKATTIKQQISQKLQNKAYIGFLKSKSSSSLTIATLGGSKIVTVNEFTQYTPARVSLKTLATDDYLVALGDVDDTDVLTAKKIIKTSSDDAPQKQINWGQVSSIGDDSFNLISKEGKNMLISTNKSTDFQISPGFFTVKKAATGSFDDLKIEKALIVVFQEEKGKNLATLVYLLPQSAQIKAKIASASAESTSSATSSGSR